MPAVTDSLLSVDTWLCSIADAVPVACWGFDDEVHKLIADRKHDIINNKMTAKQQLHLGKRQKRQLIRADDASGLNTVTGVWTLMKEEKLTAWKEKQSHKKSARTQAAAERAAAQAKRGAPNSTKKRRRKKSNAAAGDAATAQAGSALDGSRAEALLKLNEKLQQMKAARTATSSAGELQDIQRMKRRISKLKLKQRRNSLKSGKRQAAPSPASDSGGSPETKKIKKEKQEDPSSAPKVDGDTSAARTADNELIRNQEGKLVYNKFDFKLSAGARAALQHKATAKHKSGKSKPTKADDKLSGRDHKRLLDKIESRQRKVDKWKERDPEKAMRLEKNIKWSDAMQRASGSVVKDDPEKLKRSMKNKEKMKEQRKKKWEKRVETVEQQQKQKQDKRKRNIDKRKNEKIRRKMNKGAKRRKT